MSLPRPARRSYVACLSAFAEGRDTPRDFLERCLADLAVFEPVVGFSAEANATSLSWLVFNDLVSADTQQFGSAAATSILTIAGVIVLLIPVLVRTWRDFNRRAAR